MNRLSNILANVVAASSVVAAAGFAHGSAMPIFFDSFDVSTGTTDLSFEAGAPRQGGPLVPIAYLQNASDYHTQLLGVGPLQLAGDGGAPAPGQTMASPNYNFVGDIGGGLILGKCVTLSMDVGAFVGGDATSYVTGAVTIGADSPLTVDDSTAPHFAVRFVEDNFSGLGNFIQAYDGSSLVGNLIPNPAGAGTIDLRLDINDLVDGNPWDGVGSTTIDVTVNGTAVFSYTKGGGGYTGNFITMMGTPDFAGFDLATHTFENLTVYASPAVPEPVAAWMALPALATTLAARRGARVR